MRSVLLAALIGCGLYLGPLLIENTSSQCQATAHLLTSMDPAAKSNPAWTSPIIDAAGGLMLAHAAEPRFKTMPNSVTCAWAFWYVLIDPKHAEAFITGG